MQQTKHSEIILWNNFWLLFFLLFKHCFLSVSPLISFFPLCFGLYSTFPPPHLSSHSQKEFLCEKIMLYLQVPEAFTREENWENPVILSLKKGHTNIFIFFSSYSVFFVRGKLYFLSSITCFSAHYWKNTVVCIIPAICSIYFFLYILCCIKEIQDVKWTWKSFFDTKTYMKEINKPMNF